MMAGTTTAGEPDRSHGLIGLPELAAIVILVTAARIAVLASSGLGFHGDEAQYWSWSRELDWGYYTKPPMIAWVIRGSTMVCGEAEWCARAGSPLLHAGTSLLCFFIAGRLYGARAGFWAGLLFLTLPAVSFSSAVISTDVPLLFFWALALHAMLRVLDNRSIGWSLVLGLAIGFGLLSKYAMAYFVICTVLACAFCREYRWFLSSRNTLAAIVPAGIIIAPNIAWNMASGWVTVTHVGDNANLKGALFNLDEMVDFLGEQIGVFGPILFGVLLWRIVALFRGRPDPREGWLLAYTLPILAIVTMQAFLSRANANWAATAYVAATILVAGWAVTTGRLWVAKISVTLHASAAIVLAVFFLNLPGVEPPLKSDPLRKLRGWPETAAQVAKAMRDHPGRILLIDDRKVMASLLYGLRDQPWKMMMWDYDGHPDHHYELTTRYLPKPGDKVLLVAKWDNPHPILARFAAAVPAGQVRVPIGAGRERVLHLFTLDGYVAP